MSEQQQKEKEVLSQKYRAKGFQTLSLAEYEALRARKNGRRFLKTPPFIKFILGTPLLIIFLFGLLFLPWIIYVIASGPYVGWTKKKEKKEKKNFSYQDIYVKKEGSPSSSKK